MLLVVLIVPSIISWIVWDTLLINFHFPIMTKLKKQAREGVRDSILSDQGQTLVSELNSFENFSSVVANCFTNRDELDLTIESILSQMGTEVIMIKKPFLSFHTEQLEKKYRIFSLNRFIGHTRLQLTLAFLVLFVLLVLLMIDNPTTQEIVMDIGFIASFFFGLCFSFTLLFKTHINICVLFYLLSFIAASAFNSIVRGTEYT